MLMFTTQPCAVLLVCAKLAGPVVTSCCSVMFCVNHRAMHIAGARTAVCEVPFDYIASETQGGLGGTCVLRGCVPKKLLSYGGEYSNEFKGAEGYG